VPVHEPGLARKGEQKVDEPDRVFGALYLLGLGFPKLSAKYGSFSLTEAMKICKSFDTRPPNAA
jgi:hypothetical protein